MTKDEIALNKLKLGEIIEDALGRMWLVSHLYKRGNVYLACLSGKRIDAWRESLYQGCLHDPVRVFSVKWDAWPRYENLWGDDGGGLNFSACFRLWKKLPTTRKVTIEVEVESGAKEIEVNGKRVRI